jgi:hypothetical protein
MAHEYGHALRVGALDGGFYMINACTSPRTFTGVNTFGCAWDEGFADYHGAVLNASDPTNGEAQNIITGANAGLSDSPDRETAVASFLYYVTAPGGLNYGGYYVTESLKVCTVAGGHVTAIDYMAYCLAKTIDATGASSYAPFRGFTASGSVSNSAATPTGWSASAIQAARISLLSY